MRAYNTLNMADDPELAAIRQQRLAQMKAQQSGRGQVTNRCFDIDYDRRVL